MASGAALLALAGCSKEPAPAPPEEKAADSLTAGEYEVTTVVEDLRSTDNTTPLTKARLAAAGDPPLVHRACIAGDGAMAPEMFGEPGDSCKVENSYARSGTINLQLSCTRPGAPGSVLQSVAGKFKADGFTTTVNTATYLNGPGDYAMRRAMTGRRIGDCPAAAADQKAS
ncbi:MAG TPA: DUF3617 family protein [Sphingomicrobium sp.]|nr:DUF3617 family protein [Sphingomicrobium sp.]